MLQTTFEHISIDMQNGLQHSNILGRMNTYKANK